MSWSIGVFRLHDDGRKDPVLGIAGEPDYLEGRLRRIKCAEEMLAALKALVRAITDDGAHLLEVDAAIVAAKAAVAEAEGRES